MFEPRRPDELAVLDDEELNDWAWSNNALLLDKLDSLAPGQRAYLAVALFEHEINSGGFYQYFFNHPPPQTLRAVLEGYEFFGMHDARRAIEELIAPVAEHEREWRQSLQDGSLEEFMDSNLASELPPLDHLDPTVSKYARRTSDSTSPSSTTDSTSTPSFRLVPAGARSTLWRCTVSPRQRAEPVRSARRR